MSGYLIGSRESGVAPLPPEAEHQWWYQYYFATERGRAGYRENLREFTAYLAARLPGVGLRRCDVRPHRGRRSTILTTSTS